MGGLRRALEQDHGRAAAFEHSTVEAMDRLAPGGFGEEIGAMLAYAQDFGYWGSEEVMHPDGVSDSLVMCCGARE